MLVWFIYDISITSKRTKIAKLALQYGLYRVQKSVFLGSVNKNNLDELVLQCEELINKKTDSLYVFPMCKDDFRAVILKGQAFDKKMVSDEIKALFL